MPDRTGFQEADSTPELLMLWSEGEEEALTQLMPLVYDELRALAPELVALDEALDSLGKSFPQQAKIVELRYFGGLTHREIGQVLDISVPTVTRGWRMARAWLYRSLTEEDEHSQA